VICFRAIDIAKLMALLRRLETAPAPLAYSGIVLPGIGTAGFVADNIVDNQDFTGITGNGSVFTHSSPLLIHTIGINK
jgi:hypothetical protein